MKNYNIAVITGDGIGPEIVESALSILSHVAHQDGFNLTLQNYEAGAQAFLDYGDNLPPASFEGCKTADAIFKGPTGLPEVRLPDGTEAGVLGGRLRRGLDLYVNLRPVKLYPNVPCALANRKAGDIDWVMVRENTEGLYASRDNGIVANTDQAATDTMMVTRLGTERIVRYAFEQARQRNDKKRVACVDKSNVLRSMAFFRRIFNEIAANYPDIETDYLYVDAAAQAIVLEPERFDVLVTENLFGDILSDLGGATVGGVGVCAGANIGTDAAYFEPIHGSAPTIAGRGVANPLSAILSGALMLNYLGETASATRIEHAVEHAFINQTIILKPNGSAQVGTTGVTEAVLAEL